MAEEKVKFKWIDRRKATETAIKLKNEENLKPEDAIKMVMDEYEGVYFRNGSEISETRMKNFIERVVQEKKYKESEKKSQEKELEVNLSQVKIKTLLEEGHLTDLQAVVLDSVYNQLASYEFGVSDVTLSDVAEDTGLKANRVKGALGHLVKKGFLYTADKKIGDEMVSVIFIESAKRMLYNDELLKYQEEFAREKASAESIEEDEVTDEEIAKVMAELNNVEKEEPAI